MSRVQLAALTLIAIPSRQPLVGVVLLGITVSAYHKYTYNKLNI